MFFSNITAKCFICIIWHLVSLQACLYKEMCLYNAGHSSGAVCESRWPSWAARPNEPYGFRGRKAIWNHAHTLVSACP